MNTCSFLHVDAGGLEAADNGPVNHRSSAPALPEGLHFFQRGWLSSNNILLIDAVQAVLIDTGYWTHAAQTCQLVTSVLGSRPLTGILNTHLHSDHCGGNATLQQKYPGVQTQVPPGHAAHVFDWDPAMLSYTPTGQHCPPFRADDTIEPGTSFSVNGLEWHAHAAPGHDPNAIILHAPAAGVLISGDALWENGFGVVFPEIEGIAAFAEVEATLDLIEVLQPKIVLPGHGGIIDDTPQALTRARSRLHSFRNDPGKHAQYAAKVLLKFKLLELQHCEQDEFVNWAAACSYLQLLHAKYAQNASLQEWLIGLCDSLLASHAAAREGNSLLNLD